MKSWVIKSVLGFSCLGFIAACASFNVMSDAKLNAMGLQAYQEVMSKEKLSNNAQAAQAVKEIGRKIAIASGEDFEWEFNLIESDQANAFALPGGKVAVYTGILPIAQTYAGLATVMGHEVAHATARHGGKRVSQNMVTQLGLSVASITLQNKQNAPMLMAALGMGANVGVTLPFSRGHESEADMLGLMYMSKAGYDPRAAAGFWERMNSSSAGSTPEFMSTHPDPVKRAAKLREKAQDYYNKYYTKSSKQGKKRLPY